MATAVPASGARSRMPRTSRTSRSLGPTPDTSEGADLELLLQLEGRASADGEDDEVFTLNKKPQPSPQSSPENPRRRLRKRIHTDTFEITDEFSESTVVTQTLERLGPGPSARERARNSSSADIPEVLVEAVDEDVEMSDQSDKYHPPATPAQTPVVEEDENEWIEVDHLLDEPDSRSSSAMVPSEQGAVESPGPSTASSTDRFQLVLRTMTNKLLQHRRTVRRVKRRSPSPTSTPPATERDRERERERSRSPLTSAAAEPGNRRDDDHRADARNIDWTAGSTEAGPSTPRVTTPHPSPPKRRSAAATPPPSPEKNAASPPKGMFTIDPRRPMATPRDTGAFRSALRSKKCDGQPFPDPESESSGTVTPAEPVNVSVRQTFRAPVPTVVESPSPSPVTLRGPPVPPTTPFGPRRMQHGSLCTRSSRIQASSSQIFTAGQRDTAANLFPHEPLIKNIHRFMRYSSAAYGQNFLRIFGLGNADFNFPTTGRHHANSWAFAHHTNIPIDALLLSSFTETEAYSPAFAPEKAPPLVHYVAVEHSLQAIILTCRGTLGLSDVLVDLTCDYREITVEGGDPDGSYFAHSGMYESATQLTAKHSRVHQTLVDALEQYPNYGLILCGHSLGGGVAALLAINSAIPADEFRAQNAAREDPILHPYITTPFVTSFSSGLPAGRPIHCYAYGIPAVASSDLARFSSGLITSIIMNADVVPTLSLGVLRDLKNIAVTLFEERGVAEEIVGRVMGLNRSKFGAESAVGEEQMQADWMMSLIKTLRADMNNDKLFPPGSVYIMVSADEERYEGMEGRGRLTVQEYFDVFVTADEVSPDGKATSNKQAQRVILRQCDSVEERFREPLFSKTMLNDHLPSHYERSTQLLYDGLGQGLL